MKIRKIIVLILAAAMCLALAACGSSKSTSSEMSANLDKAVGEALLKNSAGEYQQAECSGEGHVIMGYDSSGDTVTAYVQTMVGQYGFQDGNFVKVSGSGIIPAVMTFKNENGTLTCSEIKFPEDGDGYKDSVNKLFPQNYRARALSPKDTDASSLKSQEQAYAEAYLKSIGRTAKIGEYGDFQHPLPDISTQASNNLTEFEQDNGYPMWLGNQETLENGVRYVYEKSWDKSAGEIIYTKYEYGTNKVVEKYWFSDTDGMQIKK